VTVRVPAHVTTAPGASDPGGHNNVTAGDTLETVAETDPSVTVPVFFTCADTPTGLPATTAAGDTGDVETEITAAVAVTGIATCVDDADDDTTACAGSDADAVTDAVTDP
jgi:hypothetical protein